MELFVKAFPQVHFVGYCRTHECKLELVFQESKTFTTNITIGGTLTSARCMEGGTPHNAKCMDGWEINILAGGPISVGM